MTQERRWIAKRNARHSCRQRFGRGQFRCERGGLLPDQHADAVNGFLNRCFERRNGRESQVEQRAAA